MMNKYIVLSGMLLAGALQMEATAKTDDWAIYWYLCGSNLESESGAATADLIEMMEVSLPSNIKVVVETGGASEWKNETINPNYLERYVYTEDRFERVGQEKNANMGDPDTLADFLRFCTENYPAEHEAVIFWNHGGGSVQGAAFDENYGFDSLTLDEFYQAFSSSLDLSSDNPPLEMVGFDTCLMATIDTAATFSDVAKYLVASEELEPGCGWEYEGWMSALAKKPTMNGAELGKVICDTFLNGCESIGDGDEVTLSVVDLQKIPALCDAFENVGAEALDQLFHNPGFFTEFSKQAKKAENYGGNTASAGYSNMVDLGDLIKRNKDILPNSSGALLDALKDCVTYKINGDYRSKSSGLSCYFSYNNDSEELQKFMEQSFSNTFPDLYEYCFNGEITENFQETIEASEYEEEDLEEIPLLDEVDEGDIPVYFDEEGYALIEVPEDAIDAIAGVYCDLGYWDEEEDSFIWFGYDNDIDMDWENGIFRDNFRDVWGAIDGHLCYMDLVYDDEDYNLYLVPILLNGEEYQLHVVFDYEEEEYYILGARRGLDDNGMSDRNLVQLEPGDEITTLLYYQYEDEMELYESETFEVTEDTWFEEEELGDGNFVMSFILTDCRYNEIWSEYVLFTVEDGEIYADYL